MAGEPRMDIVTLLLLPEECLLQIASQLTLRDITVIAAVSTCAC